MRSRAPLPPKVQNVRNSMRQSTARLLRHLPSLLLAALAAGLAYLLAGWVFGAEQAIFAPVAAVLATGLSAGQRRLRAFEITLGVVLGLLAADLLSRVLGVGAWQLAVSVFLAMSAAVAFRASGLLSNQAAVAAVVVMTVVPHLDTQPWIRLGDALIGGAVALLVTSVPTPDSVRRATVTSGQILNRFSGILWRLRRDLADGSLSGTEARLDEMNALTTARQDLEAAAAATREQVVLGRGSMRAEHRRTLRATEQLGSRLVLLLASGRALCRSSANLVRHGDTVNPVLIAAFDELIEAVDELSKWTAGRSTSEMVRKAALTAAVTASSLYRSTSPPRVHVSVGQIRFLVVDLLRIIGLNQTDAVAALESSAGRSDGVDIPPEPELDAEPEAESASEMESDAEGASDPEAGSEAEAGSESDPEPEADPEQES